MTKYINADWLFEKYQKWLEETPYTDQTDVQLGQRIVLCDIYHDLKYAPTIDAVEVVRCEDCRFWRNEHLCLVMSRYGSIDTKAEHYCSWGERKQP